MLCDYDLGNNTNTFSNYLKINAVMFLLIYKQLKHSRICSTENVGVELEILRIQKFPDQEKAVIE